VVAPAAVVDTAGVFDRHAAAVAPIAIKARETASRRVSLVKSWPTGQEIVQSKLCATEQPRVDFACKFALSAAI
jgi:hypothetical protein